MKKDIEKVVSLQTSNNCQDKDVKTNVSTNTRKYERTYLSSQLYSPYSVVAAVSDVQYTVDIYSYSHRSTD
jgi:hypothetical protein